MIHRKYGRKQLRTAIRDLDASLKLRPLTDSDLRLATGGGSAGMCTDTGNGGAACDDVYYE
jgi:hypothetical protein